MVELGALVDVRAREPGQLCQREDVGTAFKVAGINRQPQALGVPGATAIVAKKYAPPGTIVLRVKKRIVVARPEELDIGDPVASALEIWDPKEGECDPRQPRAELEVERLSLMTTASRALATVRGWNDENGGVSLGGLPWVPGDALFVPKALQAQMDADKLFRVIVFKLENSEEGLLEMAHRGLEAILSDVEGMGNYQPHSRRARLSTLRKRLAGIRRVTRDFGGSVKAAVQAVEDALAEASLQDKYGIPNDEECDDGDDS